MNYSVMTTEQLETLKSSIEEQINDYVGMSFPSLRSELVTYEIDSVDFDEVVITANHYFNGLIRDYIVSIDGGIDDDVEYSRYVDNGDLIDGGYMPFDRLPKILRIMILEIYALYKKLETIDNILDTRAEEEEEEETEEEEEEGEESEEYEKLESLLSSLKEKFEGLESLYSSIEEKFEGLEKSISILDTHAEEEEEEVAEEESERNDTGVNTMNRIDAYNAYTVDRDFRHVANALGFHGFDYDNEDAEFQTKLEQDEELSDLLEQFEDVESSQLLMYTQNTTDFYQKHENDIFSYLKTYGYDDDYHMQTIEDIMCSRVVAYVTGVLSEYGY